MRYAWIIVFLGLMTGVLLTPVFALFFIPLILIKETNLRIYTFSIILGMLLSLGPNLQGNVEIVGFITVSKASYSIATNVKIYDNGKWKNLRHDLKIISEKLEAGKEFYATGLISTTFSYPRYVLKPSFCASSPHTTRGYWKILAFLQSWKSKQQRFIKMSLPKYAKTVNGLVFSDGNFDLSESRKVMESGLGHLFAVSGLHVGIVYAAFEILISFFTYKFYLRRSLSSLFALLFALSTGPTPSALRASLMLLTWNFFKIIDYPIEPLNVLGLVGTLNIIFEPYSVLSLSFLMSYSATGVILFFSNNLNKLPVILKSVLISLLAFLGVAPFLSVTSVVNLLSPLLGTAAIVFVTPLLWGICGSFLLNSIGFTRLAFFIMKGTGPFVYAIEKLLDISLLFPRFYFGIAGYILFIMLLLALFLHFGHKP